MFKTKQKFIGSEPIGNTSVSMYLVELVGKSTDTKPIQGIVEGSTFFEYDTGNAYMFSSSKEWVEL